MIVLRKDGGRGKPLLFLVSPQPNPTECQLFNKFEKGRQTCGLELITVHMLKKNALGPSTGPVADSSNIGIRSKKMNEQLKAQLKGLAHPSALLRRQATLGVFALLLKAPAQQQQQADDVLLACLTDPRLVWFCAVQCSWVSMGTS